MNTFFNRKYNNKLDPKACACFFPVFHLKNQIGSIFFNYEDIEPYQVIHECSHAILQYFEKINKKMEKNIIIKRGDKEELFCHLLGLLSCAILNILYKIAPK
jgi:hypothetical protein